MRFENRVLRRVSYLRGWRDSDIDGMCCAHGRKDKCIQNFGRRTGKEETTGEAHMALNLTLHELEGRDWTLMAQNTDQRRTFMNMVMNFYAP